MFKLITGENKDIEVVFNRNKNEQIASYLYRRDKCIEKVMYRDTDIINFNHIVEEYIIYYVVGYIRDSHTKEVTISNREYFYIKNGDLIQIPKNILFESDNVLINFYDQKSDITFITFNGTKTTKKTKSFGLNFVLENGWNCICVHQDQDSQYQELSENDFYDAVKNSIVNKEVYNYGVSLGGYCAIYYAGIINANVIAGSPKNSAHPNYLNERFKSLKFNHVDIKDTQKTGKRIVILYDPYQLEDVRFIGNEVLPFYKNSFLVPLPKAGHRVLESISEKNILKKYIISIVNNKKTFEVNNDLLRSFNS